MLADDHVAHARNYARRRLGILSREREQRQPTASRRTHSNRRAESVEFPRYWRVFAVDSTELALEVCPPRA